MSHRKNVWIVIVSHWLIFIAVLVAISSPVRAQVTGATLSGTLSDTTGAILPQGQVTAKNTQTGISTSAQTNSAGLYSIPNLQPGNYEVSFSATGFRTEVRSGIALTVGAQQVLNIVLVVGTSTQQIEVTTEAPVVQLVSSAIGAQVERTTVVELPLNGRDWTQLATLQPGVEAVRAQATNTIGNTGPRGNRGFGNMLTDNGHRPFENSYRINGINNNDYTNGAPGSVLGVNLGVDAIQEFSVLTTNFSAEYGRTSGAVVNAIMRSGTNQFHGSAYGFIREKELDARNFFDPSQIPPFHRNQFGISAGGPVIKNKTFIFGDFEATRESASNSSIPTVPSTAARAGTLCSVPTGVTPNFGILGVLSEEAAHATLEIFG